MECNELFKKNDPNQCCQIPFAFLNYDQDQKCKKSCENSHNTCCVFDCHYETVEFYVDGKFHKEKLMENYDSYLGCMGENAKELWLPIVKNSVDTCVELSKSVIINFV